MKILVVDDSPVTRKELEYFLCSGGYTDLLSAASAREALELIRSYQGCKGIGLVLMDIMMPEMDGIEACGRIKEMDGCRDIPVIMITADEGPERLLSAFDAGAIDCIRKPLNRIELLARVKSALRLKWEMDQRKAHEEELARLNGVKNRFLGIAAHDLRNPLMSIKFSSALLLDKRGRMSKEETRLIEMIKRTADRMSGLVNNLLDISVIESGRLELRPEKGSLKELLLERIDIYRIIAGRKGITIDQRLSDLPPLTFDPNRISQVVDNLIGNAVKFSPADSNIFVSLIRDGDHAVVSVKDEGPGISPEEQDRLFVEFQKASTRPTGGEKCTGLGLAIVKRMVNAHGGDVWVKSSPGTGSTFVFTLPMNSIH